MKRRAVYHAPEAAMIAVADAGYALQADDEAWLRGVLEAARPALDYGSFVHGWVVDMTNGFRSCVAIQMPDGADFEKHVRHQHPNVGDPDVAFAMRRASLLSASDIWGLSGEALMERALMPGFGVWRIGHPNLEKACRAAWSGVNVRLVADGAHAGRGDVRRSGAARHARDGAPPSGRSACAVSR